MNLLAPIGVDIGCEPWFLIISLDKQEGAERGSGLLYPHRLLDVEILLRELFGLGVGGVARERMQQLKSISWIPN